ncbi:MAG: M50 family metallopeptidase [Lentimicrobiaceae bacterium]|nr:M50 family metallopeptidase [Lentimicrobiaceae bacterium]
MRDILSNPTIVFYITLTTCLAVMYVPYVGKYIRVLETMIHEGGHVLMAAVVGTKINKINLFSDTSGETHIAGAGKLKTVLIALAGYPLSSAFAYGSFWAIKHHYYYIFVGTLCVITLFFLLFYIRNGYGIFWAITFIAANAYLLFMQKIKIITILAGVYADILFLSALFSCFILVYLSFKSSNKAGDATLIKKSVHLPAQITALLFLSVCGGTAFFTVKHFFPLNMSILGL